MKPFLLVLFVITAISLSGQSLIPFRKGNLWGYADLTGKVVIEPVYDRTWFFTGDDAARVLSKGLYGFIEKNGTVKIKPQYINAGDFNMGVASVSTKNETYCINLDGKRDECNAPDETQDMESEPVEHFTVYKSETGKYKIVINNTGDTLAPTFDKVEFISRYFFPQTNYFAIVYQNGMKGAYNEQGIPVVPVKYKVMDILDMESYKAKEGTQWGVLKFDGSTILPFAYDSVRKVTELLFKEDRLNKNDHFIVSSKGKFGVVDHQNKAITKIVYDEITTPTCSCPTEYVVKQNGLKGILNYKGTVVTPIKYKSIEPYKAANITLVTTSNGKEGYINRNGIEYFTE